MQRPNTLSKRVLVVDDNPVNRLVAEAFLRQRGFEVDTAVDGREALEILGRTVFDLVLMDCLMPDMDGFEATRRFRAMAMNGSAPATPIVALTAADGADERSQCVAAGMDDFIAKPFAEEELARIVQKWTQQRVNQADGGVHDEASPVDPVLDEKMLRTMIATFVTEPGGMNSAIEIFVTTITSEYERLKRAVVVHDAEAIAYSAHRIGGAALQIGGRGVGHRCRTLEQAARAAHLDDTEGAIEALKGEIQSLVEMVRVNLPKC